MTEKDALLLVLGICFWMPERRIPDAHCNGDMHVALDYAAGVKHKQSDFVAKRGIRDIIN